MAASNAAAKNCRRIIRLLSFLSDLQAIGTVRAVRLIEHIIRHRCLIPIKERGRSRWLTNLTFLPVRS